MDHKNKKILLIEMIQMVRRTYKLGSIDPPLRDGSSWCPFASMIYFSLSTCNGQKYKIAWTQVGTQMWWDNSGDNENDPGEEWMKNPLIYNKVWAKLGIGK